MICPKCNYERKESDQAPVWQCPSCGIVYEKFNEIQKHIAKEQRELIDQSRDNYFRSKKIGRIEVAIAALAVLYLIIYLIFGGSINYGFWIILFGITFLVLTIGMLKYRIAVYYPFGYVSSKQHPILFKIQVVSGISVSLLLFVLGFVTLFKNV